MKTYTKFLLYNFFISFIKVSAVLTILIFIINIFEEIDFFKKYDVHLIFPIIVSLLNTPSIIFEIFPFIFLITTQIFFIKLIESNELKIFKYSGLNNFKILTIISIFSFVLGLIIIGPYYNFSSKVKNQYIKIKNSYSKDNKYLAVITENGLWIKDELNNKINIINASKIESEFLINVTITQFDKNQKFIKFIESNKIDISKNEWVIYSPIINENNETRTQDIYTLKTNYNLNKIQNLFSDLLSLSIYDLYKLKKNYQKLNYSIIDIEMHLNRVFSYPFYLTIITVLGGILMFNIGYQKNSIFKIILGIFISVIVYYLSYFFYALGSNEKISMIPAIWLPLFLLAIINLSFIIKINEK